MVKRKKSNKEGKSKRFLKALWKVLFFLIKIPYFIVKGLITLFRKTKTKIEKENIEDQRESMSANYSQFKVIKTVSGNFKKWEDKISNSDSTIGLILGARGTGKTAFGLKILENIYANKKNKKNFYVMGFKENDMPSWIDVVNNTSEIKNNSLILIDEGGVLFSSRKAMTNANKILSELLLIARHKNISIIFISQNSSNLEVNAIRQADYILLKPSSLLQKDFERKKIREIYEGIESDFKIFKDVKGIAYIYSDDFQGFVDNPLPSFWNQKISKSFS
ncbi:hypothetical protein K0A97_02040 [Patescibacteria group bacterium]|nr:hypothetical protein [Patescibacteria group bacterium]